MNYLKSYENEAAYLADATEARMKSGDFLLPNVSFIQNTKAVHYNKYREFPAEVGDIYVSDGTNNWFVNPIIYRDELANDDGVTPIGILVVPKAHMTDNKDRVMSLTIMSCDAPETGITDTGIGGNIKFGYSEEISSLPVYTYFRTNNDVIINNINPDSYHGIFAFPDETGSAISTATYILISPYLSDSISKNPSYFNDTNAPTSDLNGEYNTNVIIDLVTADWSGSTIANASGAGQYPAVCCCKRFHTLGTTAGDWYLPSYGELGYICAKNETIQNSINILNAVKLQASGLYVILNGRKYYDSYTSSTINATNSVYYINCNGLSDVTKKFQTSCFRAFLKV